tara:strand:- start:288 stop:674 length:387 start_codon:yes stop_codon:yes gene_type:complete
MKSLETLKQEFATLEANYRANPLPMGKEYRAFAKKWKSLQSKIRTYNNATNRMKRAGLKTTKQDSYYRVEYKGIVALVWLDGCEVDFWNVEVIEGDLEDLYYVQHETKSDAIWFLFGEINEANGLDRN